MVQSVRRVFPVVMVCLLLVASGAGAAQNNLAKNGNPLPATPQPPVQVLGPASITQSTNPNLVTTGSSVSCNNGAAGGFQHTDNSYYRAFTLSAFNPPLDQLQFAVQSVTFGIEQANASGVGTMQPVTVNVYNASANPPTLATLGPVLGTVTVMVPDQVNTLFTAALPAPVVYTVASGILVVEIFTPNGQPGGHSFFIGSNGLGQSGPSFIRAATCGVSEITNTASIGFPNMHLVMTVNGNSQMPVDLQTFTIE